MEAIDIRIIQDGIFFIRSLNLEHENLFTILKKNIDWDNSMLSRKTASFGVPYNYSEMAYSKRDFPELISHIAKRVELIVGYQPNNCLINYYYHSSSKMGFHSDQIDVLDKNTGIAIISLGAPRTMRFKNKLDKSFFDLEIEPDSLLYMTQSVQQHWLHAILPNNGEAHRISMTFRRIKQ